MGVVKMEPEGKIHTFWFREGEPVQRLEAMVDLRDYIDDLPQTAQSFTLTDIEGWHRRIFTEEMLRMVGSWKIPEPFARSQNARRWMNPNYGDKHRFPEVYARCDCGAILSRGYNDGGNSFRKEHDHSEDCTVPDRLRARAEMLEKRRDVIRRTLRLGRSGRQISARIGIEAKGLGEICKALGISIAEEKEVYKACSGRTYAYLSEEYDVDTELLGDAYGYHKDTLARRAQEYADCEYNTEEQEWLIPSMETEESGTKRPNWMEERDDE